MRPVLSFLLAGLLGAGILPARAEETTEKAAASKLERVLSEDQRSQVMRSIEPCWHKPAGIEAGTAVTLLVMVDANDVTMDATVVPEDIARVDTPALRGFAMSALTAVTDRHCSHVPVPDGHLARPWLFRLRFVI